MSVDEAQLMAQLQAATPEQRAAMLNHMRTGLDALLGLTFVRIEPSRIEASYTAQADHVQPFGLLHGGVYCALVESVCSVGASLTAMQQGRRAVGVQNTTQFLRGTRPGTTLTLVAEPDGSHPSTDTRTWWKTQLTDPTGRLCATGFVELAILSRGSRIAGADLRLRTSDTD